MHYFFRNTKTINEFLLNISENLKLGGKMIATFFDGEKIFKLLDGHKKVECKDDDGKLLWRIEKKYQASKFTADEKSISLPINVYIETFTKSFEEYLINVSYLRDILPLYGLEIQSIKSFRELQKEIRYQELTSDQEVFSFLNSAMVIIKTKELDREESEMSGGGDKNNLDIFISRQEQLGGGISETEDILDDSDDSDDEDAAEDKGDFSHEVMEENLASEDELTEQNGGTPNLNLDETESETETDKESDIESESQNVNNSSVVPEENILDLGDIDELDENESDPVFLQSQDGGGKSSPSKTQESDNLETTKLSTLLDIPDLEHSNIDLLSKGQSLGNLEEPENNNSVDFNEQMEEINLKLQEIKDRGLDTKEPVEEEEEKPVEKNIKVVKIDLDKKRM